MVTRREALKGMAAAGVAAALLPLAALAADGRPNILWISCEDISPHLGCYGDRFAKTPNLDKLASEGIRYTRAYTVAGVCAPSRSGIITGMYPSTLGSQHMRCKATLPDFVRGFPEYLRKAGYYTTNCSKTDYNARIPSGLWDESSRKAHWKKRPRGKPFFAVFNHTGTHESKMRALTPPRGLKPGEKQDPAALDLPPHYPDTPNSRQNYARAYETTTGTHVPLIVRIPEKFRAAGQGKPGTVDDRLVNFIDLGPTVLNLAGVDVPKHMQGRAFLGPDLPPEREFIFGARCRIDERYDIIRAARGHRYRYIRNYEPFKTWFQWVGYAEKMPMMVDMRRLHAEGKLPPAAAQFMAPEKPPEELYDTENDPYEVRNLAADPAHRQVLERLRAAMDGWMLESRDTGLVPEGELEEREAAAGSRYAVLHQPGSERLLKHLMEVARAAGAAKPEHKALFTEALSDRDAAVRYWGMTGLGLLARKDAASSGAAVKAARNALEDASAVVRIAAARALIMTDTDIEEVALPALVKELAAGTDGSRTLAANVIDDLGDRARPALDEFRKPANQKSRYAKRVLDRIISKLGGRKR
ncbi:MAG: sulfatase family protein [Planctomycetota bacterium]|jgi:uncharacterized sulfatase